MMLIINFLCQLRLDPELMKRVHMNVWHQRRTANHNTEQARERAARFKTRLLKVKRSKNMKNFYWSTCPWTRTNKGNDLALFVQSQVKLVYLVNISDNIQRKRLKHVRSHVYILSIDSTTYLYYIWFVYIILFLNKCFIIIIIIIMLYNNVSLCSHLIGPISVWDL